MRAGACIYRRPTPAMRPHRERQWWMRTDDAGNGYRQLKTYSDKGEKSRSATVVVTGVDGSDPDRVNDIFQLLWF